jgi:hypothetical protein
LFYEITFKVDWLTVVGREGVGGKKTSLLEKTLGDGKGDGKATNSVRSSGKNSSGNSPLKLSSRTSLLKDATNNAASSFQMGFEILSELVPKDQLPYPTAEEIRYLNAVGAVAAATKTPTKRGRNSIIRGRKSVSNTKNANSTPATEENADENLQNLMNENLESRWQCFRDDKSSEPAQNKGIPKNGTAKSGILTKSGTLTNNDSTTIVKNPFLPRHHDSQKPNNDSSPASLGTMIVKNPFLPIHTHEGISALMKESITGMAPTAKRIGADFWGKNGQALIDVSQIRMNGGDAQTGWAVVHGGCDISNHDGVSNNVAKQDCGIDNNEGGDDINKNKNSLNNILTLNNSGRPTRRATMRKHNQCNTTGATNYDPCNPSTLKHARTIPDELLPHVNLEYSINDIPDGSGLMTSPSDQA